VKRVKGHHGIGQLFFDSFDEGLGHVNGRIGDLFRCAAMSLKVGNEAADRCAVLTGGAEQQSLLVKIEEEADVPSGELLGLPGIEQLPAIRWKLMNLNMLAQKNARKYRTVVESLRQFFCSNGIGQPELTVGAVETGVMSQVVHIYLNELRGFIPALSSMDLVWELLFPDDRKHWHHLLVRKYRDTFYITDVIGRCETIEVTDDMVIISAASCRSPRFKQCNWEPLLQSALNWFKIVRKDWIKANRQIQEEYPLRCRYGTVPHAIVRHSLPDIYRLDDELGAEKSRQFVSLVEEGYFFRQENMVLPAMTASDYFKYCRVAYLAGIRADETIKHSLTGRHMYERYADGRHEGLLEIDPDSTQEFADWIDGSHPKRTRGGHPWEIKRGGNTTHIDLHVYRPNHYNKEDFKVELRAESVGRLAETIRMFLAIRDAGLPISIADHEAVRKRVLGQDSIGVIPSYAMLHRAKQHFAKDDDVFDVMHYDDLGRFKRRITPFITWKPLPVLQPIT